MVNTKHVLAICPCGNPSPSGRCMVHRVPMSIRFRTQRERDARLRASLSGFQSRCQTGHSPRFAQETTRWRISLSAFSNPTASIRVRCTSRRIATRDMTLFRETHECAAVHRIKAKRHSRKVRESKRFFLRELSMRGDLCVRLKDGKKDSCEKPRASHYLWTQFRKKRTLRFVCDVTRILF